jgi:hypothetical protein
VFLLLLAVGGCSNHPEDEAIFLGKEYDAATAQKSQYKAALMDASAPMLIQQFPLTQWVVPSKINVKN